VSGIARAPDAAVPAPYFGQRLPAQQWFGLAAVVWLPFTYALTLDLRFPFKLSELMLVLAGLAVLAELRLRAAPGALRLVRPLVVLVLLSAGVLFFFAANPLLTVESGTFDARFGAAGDGLAKLAYLLLAIFGFLVLSYAAYRDTALFARAWVGGALAGAGYAWLLFVLSVIGAPPLLLPGMSAVQYIALGEHSYIRSGPMVEGNYFGLFLVCSTAVAVYARRWPAALVLSATTVITFSTANLLGLGILWLGVAWSATASRRDGRGRLAGQLTLVAAGVTALLLLGATGYAAEVLIGKLATADPGSKLDRIDQALAGILMFADHPLTGVGLGQYGFHYKAYQLTDFFRGGESVKPIPNNVYVEVLAETGVAGAALFGLFLVGLLRRARGREVAPLRWGMLAMLLVFNAFPSYTPLFIWAFWALLVAAARRGAGSAPPAPAAS
jgi:O-antigen ligase